MPSSARISSARSLTAGSIRAYKFAAFIASPLLRLHLNCKSKRLKKGGPFQAAPNTGVSRQTEETPYSGFLSHHSTSAPEATKIEL